ncbi:hypothetical protein ACFFWD_06550 [Bradyrhizobium erythrophlei]|uniref:hypothetical protein n=1 Tax=Bradyrhizobium erythrophlei TaxID=1437360 RepID=UPI0035E98221
MSTALKQAQRRETLTKLGVPEWQIDMILGGVGDDLMADIVRDFRNGPASLPAMGGAAKVRVEGAPVVRDAPSHSPGRGWVEPPAVDDWRPPGQAIMDQMMDAHDAKWRADRKKEFGG